MKKLINPTILAGICLCFSFLVNCSGGTEKKVDAKDTIKANQQASKIYAIPKELEYKKKDSALLIDKFFPIGWSETGNFAYILEPADEATGFYFFNFCILNTKTGKMLFEFKYDTESAVEGETLQSTWQKNTPKFTEELSKAGIVQQEKFELLKSKIEKAGKQYDLKLNQKSVPNVDYGGNIIKSSTILTINGSEKKEIAKIKEEHDYTLNTEINGCLKSPYEEQFVLIFTKEQRGYEGPPNLLLFNLLIVKF